MLMNLLMPAKAEARQYRKKKTLTEWLRQIEPSHILDFNHLTIENYGQNYSVRTV